MNAPVASVRTYAVVYVTLLVLTVATTAVARVDLGRFNVVAAITIAVCKALLVAFFFMHLLHTNNRTKVMAGAGILWLLILIGLTVSDVLTRGWIPAARGW